MDIFWIFFLVLLSICVVLYACTHRVDEEYAESRKFQKAYIIAFLLAMGKRCALLFSWLLLIIICLYISYAWWQLNKESCLDFWSTNNFKCCTKIWKWWKQNMLNMAMGVVRRIFYRGDQYIVDFSKGSQKDFSMTGGQQCWIFFLPTQNEKKNLFPKNLIKK